jgi:hypothetical protein
MYTGKLFLISLVLASSVSLAYGGDIMVGDPYLQPKDSSSHRVLRATVIRLDSDMVFFRTEEKTIRNLGIKDVNKDITSLALGDKADLILDRGNAILGVTEPGGKGGFGVNEITGTVQRFDRLNKRITLKTETGEIQNIELRDAVATKLFGIKKGKSISLEMDGQDQAVDAYRAE